VTAARDQTASAALTTRSRHVAQAVDRLREGARESRLADACHAADQIGMPQTTCVQAVRDMPHSPLMPDDLPIRAKERVVHAAHCAHLGAFVQALPLSFFSKQLAASLCCKKARSLDKIGTA
jgi:hypothetical protein